jgi:hypothetical protein
VKIQKGDQEAYNAKVKARIPKQRRPRVSDMVSTNGAATDIGHGSKPNHEKRATGTREAFAKTMAGHWKRTFEVQKADIWEDYEINKMCIWENANFKLLWSTEQPYPPTLALINRVAEEELVPAGEVVHHFEIALGLRQRPDEMTVEDVMKSQQTGEPDGKTSD